MIEIVKYPDGSSYVTIPNGKPIKNLEVIKLF